jgi:hypothetical protein
LLGEVVIKIVANEHQLYERAGYDKLLNEYTEWVLCLSSNIINYLSYLPMVQACLA